MTRKLLIESIYKQVLLRYHYKIFDRIGTDGGFRRRFGWTATYLSVNRAEWSQFSL